MHEKALKKGRKHTREGNDGKGNGKSDTDVKTCGSYSHNSKIPLSHNMKIWHFFSPPHFLHPVRAFFTDAYYSLYGLHWQINFVIDTLYVCTVNIYESNMKFEIHTHKIRLIVFLAFVLFSLAYTNIQAFVHRRIYIMCVYNTYRINIISGQRNFIMPIVLKHWENIKQQRQTDMNIIRGAYVPLCFFFHLLLLSLCLPFMKFYTFYHNSMLFRQLYSVIY